MIEEPNPGIVRVEAHCGSCGAVANCTLDDDWDHGLTLDYPDGWEVQVAWVRCPEHRDEGWRHLQAWEQQQRVLAETRRDAAATEAAAQRLRALGYKVEPVEGTTKQ